MWWDFVFFEFVDIVVEQITILSFFGGKTIKPPPTIRVWKVCKRARCFEKIGQILPPAPAPFTRAQCSETAYLYPLIQKTTTTLHSLEN